MFLIQAALPASLVFILFIAAHFFVANEGSGIYLPETNWDGDEEDQRLEDDKAAGALHALYEHLSQASLSLGSGTYRQYPVTPIIMSVSVGWA